MQYVCGPNTTTMTAQNTGSSNYKSLYNFLAVLNEDQVHKLHKVASGMLTISAFSADEIEQLEKKLSLSASNHHFMLMNNN